MSKEEEIKSTVQLSDTENSQEKNTVNNQEENNQVNNLNTMELEKNWAELAQNIQVQIQQYRSMLMCERGKSQLDGKKHKQRKIALRKTIARLESIKTNPHSLHKVLKDMSGYKQLMEEKLRTIKEGIKQSSQQEIDPLTGHANDFHVEEKKEYHDSETKRKENTTFQK